MSTDKQIEDMTPWELQLKMEAALLTPLAVGPEELKPRDKVFAHYPLNKWWACRKDGDTWIMRYRNRGYQQWEKTDRVWGKVFYRDKEVEFEKRRAVIQDRVNRVVDRGFFLEEDFVVRLPGTHETKFKDTVINMGGKTTPARIEIEEQCKQGEIR